MVLVIRVKYRCTNPQCRAEDGDKLFENERVAPYIICWNCKAGSGMSPQQMQATNTGMALIGPQEEPQTEALPA